MTFPIVSEPEGCLPSCRHGQLPIPTVSAQQNNTDQCVVVGTLEALEQRLEPSCGIRVSYSRGYQVKREQRCLFQAWLSRGGSTSVWRRGVGTKGKAPRERKSNYSQGQQEWRAKEKPYLHFPSWSQQPWARLQRSLQSSPTEQKTGGAGLSRDHR